MRHILFVCTGNICRSPMAAALLRHKLAADGKADQVEVSSAGTWALVGRPASERGRIKRSERGIDMADHRARDVDAEMIRQADLVLTMTESHREALLVEFPEARDKTFLLAEMVGRGYDIADPYGGSPEEYDACARELADLVERGYGRILELANRNP